MVVFVASAMAIVPVLFMSPLRPVGLFGSVSGVVNVVNVRKSPLTLQNGSDSYSPQVGSAAPVRITVAVGNAPPATPGVIVTVERKSLDWYMLTSTSPFGLQVLSVARPSRRNCFQ